MIDSNQQEILDYLNSLIFLVQTPNKEVEKTLNVPKREALKLRLRFLIASLEPKS